jgi:hypothetical protein
MIMAGQLVIFMESLWFFMSHILKSRHIDTDTEDCASKILKTDGSK